MARLQLIMLLALISVSLVMLGVGAGDNKSEVVRLSALLGSTVKLPCDTSPPRPENPLLLTVWFKDLLQDPIYRYYNF